MLKQATLNLQPNHVTEAAYAASRQIWLAGLGAAVVTRDWVQHEAGGVFKSLVKEGTAVESRAIRLVGDQIETSMERANRVWRSTRRTVESTVKQAAETAVALAQQIYPRSLPKFEVPFVATKAKGPTPRPARAKKIVRARKAKVVRKAKRGVKAATKRT